MDNEQSYQTESSDLPLRDLIIRIKGWGCYIKSKWLVLLIAGILGISLGLIYSFTRKPLYIASTSFVLDAGDSKGGLGRLAGMAAVAGIDLGGSAGGLFQGDNILELYRSRSMLEQALLTNVNRDSDELLIERYISYNQIKDGWRGRPELLALNFKQTPSELDLQTLRLRDSVITKFVNVIRDKLLTVSKPDKSLSIVRVDVASPDEEFSKAFNESLVRCVNDFYIQTKTKKSNDNISILEAKVDSVRAVMSGAIYTAAKVSDATPNLNPTRQVQRVAPAQEAQFSAEANRAILAQLLQNLELTKMTLLQEQPLIQIVDQPVYPLPVDQLGKIKAAAIGGFIIIFLTLIILVGMKWYRDIMGFGEEG